MTMKDTKTVADIKSLDEIIKAPVSGRTKSDKLEFFPLTVSTLERILPILTGSKMMLCDYTPGGLLYGMRRLYSPAVCLSGGNLFISVLSADRTCREYLMPIGDIPQCLEMLDSYTREHNMPFTLYGTGKYAEITARYFRCGYELSDEMCDYVFDAESLARLEGARYNEHRTSIRKLQHEHESWSYERITDSNLSDAVAFADELFSVIPEGTSRFSAAEVDIVYDTLHNLSTLSLIGGMLYVDGRAAGVAVGYVKHEMLYIHVLRTREDIHGAWNLLLREFVKDNLAGVRYVNMEDDLGDEELRGRLSSYSPIEYIKRAKATVR